MITGAGHPVGTSPALAAVDLLAASLREYDRREAQWRRMVADAASTADAHSIRDRMHDDLHKWLDIALYFKHGVTPDDSRPMARSARATLDLAKERATVSNAKMLDLLAITNAVESHAFYRHRWNPFAIRAEAERRAA